jgi:WD40 repeat protein
MVDLTDGSSRELESNMEIGEVVAVGPQGRRIAVASRLPYEGPRAIRVWDVETGAVRELDAAEQEFLLLKFTTDGRLFSSSRSGDVLSWNVDEGTYELLLENAASRFDISQDGHTLLAGLDGRATIYDLEDGSRWELSSHGEHLSEFVLDPTGHFVVTGDEEGVIRVGPVTGEEPHLLLGHKGAVSWIKVSPKGDWIASGGADHTIRLWTMPNMDQRPFHTLPHEEFLDRLKRLTNLRAVPDEESPTGYRIDIEPFPGWEKVPEW